MYHQDEASFSGGVKDCAILNGPVGAVGCGAAFDGTEEHTRGEMLLFSRLNTSRIMANANEGILNGRLKFGIQSIYFEALRPNSYVNYLELLGRKLKVRRLCFCGRPVDL